MIALVSGSNRGIGFAVAKGLLQAGHTVIISSRNSSDGEAALKELASLGDAHYHQLDITDEASVGAMLQYVKSTFGRLDILVNNAGINYDTWQNVLNADLKEVEQTFATNLLGAWRLAQAFVPMMQDQGFGRIVNVSSGAGELASQTGERPGYSISKLAMNGLTLALARFLEGSGILVNAVCPGWVRTDMGGSAAPKSPEEGAATIIWAAQLPGNGPTGRFFRNNKEISW